MNKSEKLSLPARRKARRALAATALTLTAALGSGVTSARAKTLSPEKPRQHAQSFSLRERQKTTENNLLNQIGVGFFRGALLLHPVKRDTGGTKYSPDQSGGTAYPDNNVVEEEVILNPLLVYKGSPKDQFGHDDITNGDYYFGIITHRSSGRPQVKLIKFNPDNMKLVADMSSNTYQESVVFQSDKLGNIKIDGPMTAPDGRLDAGSVPLTNPFNSEQPLQIGFVAHPKG